MSGPISQVADYLPEADYKPGPFAGFAFHTNRPIVPVHDSECGGKAGTRSFSFRCVASGHESQALQVDPTCGQHITPAWRQMGSEAGNQGNGPGNQDKQNQKNAPFQVVRIHPPGLLQPSSQQNAHSKRK